MGIFAIGDLHLSMNENVEKPMDIFGGPWIDHVDKLQREWDTLVTEKDLMIIPGDISWALKLPEAMTDLDWIHDRPGRKVLFKGNHDLWWSSKSRLNKLYEDMIFIQNDFFVLGDVAICGSRGWVCPGNDPHNEDYKLQDMKIYRRELLRLEMSLEAASLAGYGRGGKGKIIGVLHFPPTNDRKESSGFTDLFTQYGASVVIYAHLHGTDNFTKGLKGIFNGVEYKLVSLDYLKGKPVKIL